MARVEKAFCEEFFLNWHLCVSKHRRPESFISTWAPYVHSHRGVWVCLGRHVFLCVRACVMTTVALESLYSSHFNCQSQESVLHWPMSNDRLYNGGCGLPSEWIPARLWHHQCAIWHTGLLSSGHLQALVSRLEHQDRCPYLGRSFGRYDNQSLMAILQPLPNSNK